MPKRLGWAVFHLYSPSPPKAQTSLGEITEICKGYLRLYRTCTLRYLQNFNSEVLILKQEAPTQTSCPLNIYLSYPAWKNKTKSKPLIVSYKKDSCFKVTSQSLSEDNFPWQQLFETHHDSLLPIPPSLDPTLSIRVIPRMSRMHRTPISSYLNPMLNWKLHKCITREEEI